MNAYGNLCTEFYDADKQLADADELQLYQELFSKETPILEPMCGSGRALIPLLQLGYDIEGFDISTHMLKRCKQRAEKLGLNPTLFQNTVDKFSTNKQYQGVIIPLGSFQLLYPREKAHEGLEKFHRWLAPSGKLVMDLFVPWEAMYERGDVDTSTRDVKLPTGESIRIDNHTTTNKFEQHILSKTRYTKYSGEKIISEENEQMDILWYYPYEMELMLEKFGFTHIRQVKRFLNGGDHMTFIAEKGKNNE